MTAWHDQPPLSRRQLRANSPTDGDEPAITDESDAGAHAPRRAAGRRVQWDPSADAPDSETTPQTATVEVADDTDQANAVGYRVRDYRPDIRRASFAPAVTAVPHDSWAPSSDVSAKIGAAEPGSLPSEPAAPEYTMTRRALRELRQRAEAAGQEAPNVVRDADGSLALTGSIPVIDLPRDDDGQVAEPPPVGDNSAAEAEQDAGQDAPGAMSADAQSSDEPAADDPASDGVRHDRVPVEVLVAEHALATAIIDDATVREATFVEIGAADAPEGADRADDPDYADDLDDFDGDTVIAAPVRSGARNVAAVDAAAATPVETIHALIEPDTGAAEQRDEQSSGQGEPLPESLSPFDELFLPPSGAHPADEAPALVSPLLEHDGGRGVEPAPDAAPYGHWSTQAALDDASQSNEAMLSRNVGLTTGAITTHALVLPSAPSSSDHLLNPGIVTGEIMVTGSIDLPRSFGSTGAHPALFDHPDVDALIEESDREDAVSDSAPVRAIRAVSSNFSTRGVIEAPAPRKSRLPLIVGIAGGSALLVAVGVVAAGFIFNVF